jgi:hypothetical protein
MSSIELEAGKAEFVREFLNETNEDLVSELMIFFRTAKTTVGLNRTTVPKKNGKQQIVNNLLKFASENRVINKGYKFDRSDCYDR